MAKTTAKRYKKLSDTTFSQIVRSSNGCEAYGFDGIKCSSTYDCAHIISRTYSATRTSFRNAFSLCWNHHHYFHNKPRQFSRFITDTWAQEYYNDILALSSTPTKVDWPLRYEQLKTIAKDLDEGRVTLEQIRKADS